MSRTTSLAAGIALFALSLAVAVFGYKLLHFWLSPAQEGPARAVFYEVKPNEGPGTIAQDLENLGIISSARLFRLYGRITGKTRRFKAGDYRFTTAMRPDEVMAIIMSGISYGMPLTVPEGYTMMQVSELMENLRPQSGARFLKLCTSRAFIAELGFNPPPATLEGYLFPDTYLVARKESEEDIIRSMIHKFRATYTSELATRAEAIGMSEHQVITLASIIEKETGAKVERPIISAVFHNRLKKKMRLQTDPTVIYGIKNFNGNLTRKDLETPTPYNTYTIRGLPPGPISNPGREAILAALYPADVEFLFFVSHNDGTHEFSKTFEDHQRAVTKFQLDPKAREGKSWRDLKQ
jgi:UPF0755 protein